MEKRIGAAILLTLSLVAAGFAGEVDATIRLPSDGQGLEEAKTRPWTCCDDLRELPKIPPIFSCEDKVEQCADACRYCEEDEDNPSLSVCADLYTGYDPGPRCTEEDNSEAAAAADHNLAMPAVEETLVEKAKEEEKDEEGPPWKCCVRIFCKWSPPPMPLTCRCKDTVKHCASACKSCEKVSGGEVCNDWYTGDPDAACY
ncbi:Bowman-Birk type trypsin inhibitor isoform X1 [Lolium perenne]|uniref:Bowman-Birk type trypsin inhibitor isoform X1 n=1 Tax=Lolium perenne TaxID=4522 RepID=UPI0021F61B28|nr:Bowman-Birk type bran trypsin inhibitor-like isoform X1 [Lolium perenne]